MTISACKSTSLVVAYPFIIVYPSMVVQRSMYGRMLVEAQLWGPRGSGLNP